MISFLLWIILYIKHIFPTSKPFSTTSKQATYDETSNTFVEIRHQVPPIAIYFYANGA